MHGPAVDSGSNPVASHAASLSTSSATSRYPPRKTTSIPSSVVMHLDGDSYRLRSHHARANTLRKAVHPRP